MKIFEDIAENERKAEFGHGRRQTQLAADAINKSLRNHSK